MDMVAIPPPLANAHVVLFGPYGAISRHARQEGVSRQTLYRQTHAVVLAVEGTATRARLAEWAEQVRTLRQRVAELEASLGQAVALDSDRQAEFAAVAQAEGISLPVCRRLLVVLLGAAAPSVARLGRWTRQAGQRAAALLAVLDEHSRGRVRQAAADEIFVGRRPILMTVECDSLCWVGGRLAERRDGEQWAAEFGRLPALEQVTRDAGTGLEKGLQRVNADRRRRGQPTVADQLDHFHVLREGRRALRRLQGQAARALERAEEAQKGLARQDRRGGKKTGPATVAGRRWREAEAAMDRWAAGERAWGRVRQALPLFTPEGEPNTRARAEAELAAALPQLQGPEWAKARRLLSRPELFTFLDRVHDRLRALPADADLKRAALREEGLRRQSESSRSAALRGVLLVTGALWALGGEGVRQVREAVRGVLRQAWRASSLVEGLNSVLRMQQARHRRLTQGILDLKRLYWNCRRLRTGKRRHQAPYERLGLVLPGVRWWELLKIPPEQLAAELSALNPAA